MPSTKKTSGSGTAKRGTAAKRSATTTRGGAKRSTSTGSPAKRKAGTKVPAPRAKKTTRPAATPKKRPRVFRFKLLATILVCVAIVVLAVLGTVFYDKLVPQKGPITAKSNGMQVVQPAALTPVFVPTPEKAPATSDKPEHVAVMEPTGPPVKTEPVVIKPDTVAPPVTPPVIVAPKDITEAPPITTPPVTPPPASVKPKLALIFDDVGYDVAATQKLQALGLPLTFAILPYSPHGQSIAKNVPAHIEVMVHVPMQAINGDSDKEPGLLRSDMTEAELAQVLRADIARIPNAKGINNHTGSKLTQQLVPMQVVMLVLKEKNMFFVDSVTSDKSLAKTTAEMLLVPSAGRNVFLDHVADTATIKAQLYRAVNLAKKNGFAVAIGHPRPLTMEVVLQELPKIAKDADVELVPVSVLVK